MRKITLFVGLNDKISKMQEISTIDAYKICGRAIGRDCTITEGRGIYTHDDGTIVEEVSLKIEILDFEGVIDKAWIGEKVGAIKQLLNQESVAVEYTSVNSELL